MPHPYLFYLGKNDFPPHTQRSIGPYQYAFVLNLHQAGTVSRTCGVTLLPCLRLFKFSIAAVLMPNPFLWTRFTFVLWKKNVVPFDVFDNLIILIIPVVLYVKLTKFTCLISLYIKGEENEFCVLGPSIPPQCV